MIQQISIKVEGQPRCDLTGNEHEWLTYFISSGSLDGDDGGVNGSERATLNRLVGKGLLDEGDGLYEITEHGYAILEALLS